MALLKSKSSGEKRERPDYNGAVTALTDAGRVALAAKRHGAFVLVVDDRVMARDNWTLILARFAAEDKSGRRVRVMSHTDYVMRQVAEAALVAL